MRKVRSGTAWRIRAGLLVLVVADMMTTVFLVGAALAPGPMPTFALAVGVLGPAGSIAAFIATLFVARVRREMRVARGLAPREAA